MQSVRQVQRLNDAELEKCVPPSASWHTDYRDTAYIYIGGLPFELSEGDVLNVFSQYGNPVHINLVRDKETGKSRGFCFLKYEDQRSCDLAVDNLSGAGVMGRVLSVDHTRYKKKEGEVEGLGEGEGDEDADSDGGRSKRRRTETPSEESEEERPLIKEEIELQKLIREHDDDDPMMAYLVKEKKADVAEALKSLVKRKPKTAEQAKHRHRHYRSRRDGSGEEDDQTGRRHGHDRSRRDGSREEDDQTGRRHRQYRSRRDGSVEADDQNGRRHGHRSQRDDSDDKHERDPSQRKSGSRREANDSADDTRARKHVPSRNESRSSRRADDSSDEEQRRGKRSGGKSRRRNSPGSESRVRSREPYWHGRTAL